jgi:hypothetical protein
MLDSDAGALEGSIRLQLKKKKDGSQLKPATSPKKAVNKGALVTLTSQDRTENTLVTATPDSRII